MSNLLSIKNLSVVLNKKKILTDVNLSLAPGDILGLVGSSGCGKTTLLHSIAGFIRPSAGQMDIGNISLLNDDFYLSPEQRNIGMIFQDYALFPHLTVEKNITFGLSSLSKSEQAARVVKLTALLKLTELTQRYPHQLSGGQQQRVAIARALAPQPRLLLLDEPFSNIDGRLRHELMLEMRQLLKTLAITAIFVTHNKDEVFTFADKIAVMDQGKLLQTGDPSEVCRQPNSWQVADFLQLGSWIPLIKERENDNFYLSAFGKVSIKSNHKACRLHLLVKAKHIKLVPQGNANGQVNHISVTEHGYHYLVQSLTDNNDLAFTQLSFYSEQPLLLGQQISLSLNTEDAVVFEG